MVDRMIDLSPLYRSIIEGARGKQFEEDDYSNLLAGSRMSPKAVRTLIAAIWNGSDQLIDGTNQLSDQFRWSALLYGYYCDMITPEEFEACLQGNRIKGNFIESEADMFVDHPFDNAGNIVFGSIQQVHEYLQEERTVNPNLQVVLAHGKWNGIPHQGHIFCVSQLAAEINKRGYVIDPQNLRIVVLAETNSLIKEFGSNPFLNTIWRVSLMSYVDEVDIIAPSGEYNARPEVANAYWMEVYRLLWPNFVNVAPDHLHKANVYQRCREIGAETIELIHKPGDLFPIGHQFYAPRASSTSLSTGNIEDPEFRFGLTALRYLKEILIERFGRRDLFS